MILYCTIWRTGERDVAQPPRKCFRSIIIRADATCVLFILYI